MASSAKVTTDQLPRFRSLLAAWQKKQGSPTGFTSGLEDLKKVADLEDSKDVVVAFRTRPPLENEVSDKFQASVHSIVPEAGQSGPTPASGQGDVPKVEFCPGVSLTSAEPGVFVAHVPGMKWNGPTLSHKTFDADLAFGPDISNEEVYQRTVVANDVLKLALGGGIGCILAYGQTGTGKTFTMEGLEHRISRDLFNSARAAGKVLLAAEGGKAVDDVADADADRVFQFNVTFLELLGRRAEDLVEPNTTSDANGNPVRQEIAIHEDKVGNVTPRLISTPVNTSADLENLINASLAHRRTSATLRNAASSRSHALLTIRAKNTLLPFCEEGQLILVDLAGSERYEDSKAHDKQRMDESRENNKSLMNLKECVRAKAKMAADEGFVHIPWRMNKLTMLLKPIFDVESRQLTKTIIIAHVSPHIQDSVHSVNTLSYAAPFKTTLPKQRGPAPYDPVDPRTWDYSHTIAWFNDQFVTAAREQKGEDGPTAPVDVDALCPEGMTARHFGKMVTTEFVGKCLSVSKVCEPWSAEEVKAMAATVIGNLFYLILSAKTRKRNDVMRTRKTVEVTSTYGEAPKRFVDGKEVEQEGEDYPDGDVMEARIHYDKEWDKILGEVIAKARAADENPREAYVKAVAGLVQTWRETVKATA